jgi:hypothetical protein
LQLDLKRARIVLWAADGRSTRSIAKEAAVQPRCQRFAARYGMDHPCERYSGHAWRHVDDNGRMGSAICSRLQSKKISSVCNQLQLGV